MGYKRIVSLLLAITLVASLFFTGNPTTQAGTIPLISDKEASGNQGDPNTFYFIAMFSYAIWENDAGKWQPLAPGGDAVGVEFPYSFDIPNRKITSIEVVPFTNTTYLSNPDKWKKVFQKSRSDQWDNYKDQSNMGFHILKMDQLGVGTSSVSFKLVLQPGSYLNAPLPKRSQTPSGNIGYTYYFPMLLTIKVEPQLIVKHFTTDGQSLASVFPNTTTKMVAGQSYQVTPPTNENYTYKGYKKSTTDNPPSGSLIPGNPPKFTYDNTFNTYTLFLYYEEKQAPPPDNVQGTIHVRHMVRTSSSSDFSKVKEQTFYYEKLPVTETFSGNTAYGTLIGRNQNNTGGYSDTVYSFTSPITVNLYNGQPEVWVSFFYENPNGGGGDDGGGGTIPDPLPEPEPEENHPPIIQIAWSKPNANLGDVVNLQVTQMYDPDPGDWVSIVGWDFTKSTDWLAGLPEKYNLNLTSSSFSGITADKTGAHTVYITATDTHGEQVTASATLNVVDPKPVAVIDAPSVVRENHPLPSPIDGSRSYSPIGRNIVDYVWTNKKDVYTVPGTETVTLKVKDDEGRWSDVTTKDITVLPDEPPIVTLTVPPEETRLGTLTIKSNAYSPDGDKIVSRVFQYKYDAGNDGFDNDNWQTYSTANVDTYAFKPTRIGKYLFRESVCEDYGKCGNSDSQPVAQRTADIQNLPPSIDVKTRGSLTDPPETYTYLMSDLYASGRFVNLQTGAVGNKDNWKLDNGVLKTKTRVRLTNVGLDVQFPFFQLYSQESKTKVAPFYHALGELGSNSLGLEENPHQAPFAGLQNNNASFAYIIPSEVAGKSMIALREDEKYTYILAVDAGWTGYLYAYDKSFRLVWSKILPRPVGHVRSFYTGRINYGNVDGILMIHNHTVYVGVSNPNNPYQYFLLALDRENGAEKHRITYSWVGGVGTEAMHPIGLPDGILIANNKYDFNGNLVAYAPYLNGVVLGVSSKYGRLIRFGLESGKSNEFVQKTSDLSTVFDLGDPAGYASLSRYTFLGYDAEGTSYGVYRESNEVLLTIQRHTLTGAATKKTFTLPDYRRYIEILGKDAANRIWISTQTSSTWVPVVYVYDADGQLLQTLYPFGNLFQGSVDKMFIGSDGVVTLFGMYYNQGKYQVYYASYDPDTFAVMASGASPAFQHIPAYIYPHDDQSFLIEFRGDVVGSYLYLLKTSGSLKKPKLFEAGEPTPDIVIGANVPEGSTVRANFMPNNVSAKGVGYLYRVQDDRNYYSIEFEAGELRIKKTAGGSASIVFSRPYTLVSGKTYEVMIKPAGNTFEVYVNKIWQATVTETAWTGGKFGVISRGQEDVWFISAAFYAGGNGTGSIEGVVLVGETLTYDVVFDDPENDPRLTAGEAWKYVHNPNVFLQPQGTWSGSGQSFPGPVTSFGLPGEYTFTFRTKDDPHPEHHYPDNAFAAYRQESNEVTGRIRVHRRPVADQDVILNPDFTLAYVDRSYDPDRFNPANGQYSTENTGINYAATRGIIERKYRYRSANSLTYVYAKPTRLMAGSYIVELSVKDEYGAWSDWDSDLLVVSGSPVLPPNPGFTVMPLTGYRGTPFTINSTASDPQDGGRENLEHQYWIKNLTAGGAETLQSISRTQWTKTFNSMGTFRIRQVVINSYGLYAETSQNVSVVNRKPAANVTTPASASPGSPTEFDLLRPQFVWTYGDADGDAQTQYQVQVIKSNSGGLVLLDSGARIGGTTNWTASADLPEEVVLYVQVRVYDGYDWSDWSSPKYFIIDTNKPPTGDFDWNPKLIFEGDTVMFESAVNDLDLDVLNVRYELESPDGTKRTFAYTWSAPYPDTGPVAVLNVPGVWTMTLNVSDGEEAVTVSKSIRVWPLTISGQVRHTDEWEANRLNYNAKHPETPRPANWFWAGEAFVLEALVTDTGASATKPLRVTADAGSGLRKELAGSNPPQLTRWNGTLRSEDAGFPLVELPEGDYTFTFTVTYSNGVVKTAQAAIRIVDTVDSYVQVHRVR